MSEQQPDAPAKLPAIQSGNPVRAIVPNDFDSAFRIANAVFKSGMAPRGIDSAEKAMVTIMHGMEVGMSPMMALQSIAMINGRPCIWGDGALGLVQGSGLMEWHKEFYEGTEGTDSWKAVCEVKRKNDKEPKRGEFSISDAKRAQLFGKQGPWQQYTKRMLMMRARGFSLRNGFSDVLRGLSIAEEAQDIVPVKDISSEPPAPPKVAEPPAPPSAEPPKPDTVKPEPAKVIEGEIIHPPINPEDVLAWVKKQLDAVTDPYELSEVWEMRISPKLDGLFPPDRSIADGYYRDAEKRLDP